MRKQTSTNSGISKFVMKKIPGLNDLRIFEAAARLQHFRQAAEELHLTQSAVSHRIRSLEDRLGLTLFERQNGVSLTDAGRELYDVVKQSLDRLSEGIEQTTQRYAQHKKRVRLSLLPGFAAYWLLPRLNDFYQQYPEVEIQIEAGVEAVELGPRGADLAIRFGRGDWQNCHAQLFLHEYYYLVAAPVWLEQFAPLTMDDLRDKCLLLHANAHDPGASWEQLLAYFGCHSEDLKRTIRFDDSNLILQAALRGHGLALEKHSLVADLVRDKKLQQVLQVGLKSTRDYYLLCSDYSATIPEVKLVSDWLMLSAEEFSRNQSAALSSTYWCNLPATED